MKKEDIGLSLMVIWGVSTTTMMFVEFLMFIFGNLQYPIF